MATLIFSCNKTHWSCDMAAQAPLLPPCSREEEREHQRAKGECQLSLSAFVTFSPKLKE